MRCYAEALHLDPSRSKNVTRNIICGRRVSYFREGEQGSLNGARFGRGSTEEQTTHVTERHNTLQSIRKLKHTQNEHTRNHKRIDEYVQIIYTAGKLA